MLQSQNEIPDATISGGLMGFFVVWIFYVAKIWGKVYRTKIIVIIANIVSLALLTTVVIVQFSSWDELMNLIAIVFHTIFIFTPIFTIIILVSKYNSQELLSHEINNIKRPQIKRIISIIANIILLGLSIFLLIININDNEIFIVYLMLFIYIITSILNIIILKLNSFKSLTH